MCGLSGFLVAERSGLSFEAGRDCLRSMGDAIAHRGPDSEGIWLDEVAGLGFAHRRLAIVEVSDAGAQPMISHCGRYVLAFNGEIYNHADLRKMLVREGHFNEWRGQSDTETLLEGIVAWGLDWTLQRAIGMFAFAVWDRESRTLTLARDRFGEKPMYYGWQGQGTQSAFLFGSELSALRRHPSFVANIDRDALALYMRFNCIGGAHSIYKGIHKLLPGHLLTVSAASPEPVTRQWWSGAAVTGHGFVNPFVGSPLMAVDALESLLYDAIGKQMMADVPLGAFLSGGIDSSVIVAIMQAQSSRPIRTFSIGFYEHGYNEAMHAKAVANHLGTDHTELYVTSNEAMAVIPRLPSLYSEPFADSSQIATYLVSQLAREHVKVSLSGDAGDELFGGYNRYKVTNTMWGSASRMPYWLRRSVAGMILLVNSERWDWLGRALHISRLGENAHKSAALLGSHNFAELYKNMVSIWTTPAQVVLGASEPASILTNAIPELARLGDVERMMALDMLSYLPDDILTKVDRASMGASLESRVPMLDHRVVEFAWSLPLHYKLRHGVTKWPLREVLYRHVPRKLVDRPKMGFGVPIDHWLRGPMRERAEHLLTESRLRSEGYFDPIPIRRMWAQHLSGQHNWQHQLWTVLMFQEWLIAQRG